MRSQVVIVFIATFAVLVVFWRYQYLASRKERAADQRMGIINRFGDIGLTRTHLVDGMRSAARAYPLAGLRARVEDAGQLTSRITVTRLALTGPFALALRKKADHRSVFLTIEGPGVAIVREIPERGNPGVARIARTFASRVNAQAMAIEANPPAATRPRNATAT